MNLKVEERNIFQVIYILLTNIEDSISPPSAKKMSTEKFIEI